MIENRENLQLPLLRCSRLKSSHLATTALRLTSYLTYIVGEVSVSGRTETQLASQDYKFPVSESPSLLSVEEPG